jgi:hypothetical protein
MGIMLHKYKDACCDDSCHLLRVLCFMLESVLVVPTIDFYVSMFILISVAAVRDLLHTPKLSCIHMFEKLQRFSVLQDKCCEEC